MSANFSHDLRRTCRVRVQLLRRRHQALCSTDKAMHLTARTGIFILGVEAVDLFHMGLWIGVPLLGDAAAQFLIGTHTQCCCGSAQLSTLSGRY